LTEPDPTPSPHFKAPSSLSHSIFNLFDFSVFCVHQLPFPSPHGTFRGRGRRASRAAHARRQATADGRRRGLPEVLRGDATQARPSSPLPHFLATGHSRVHALAATSRGAAALRCCACVQSGSTNVCARRGGAAGRVRVGWAVAGGHQHRVRVPHRPFPVDPPSPPSRSNVPCLSWRPGAVSPKQSPLRACRCWEAAGSTGQRERPAHPGCWGNLGGVT
jgi:hypothetical protein